MFHLFLLIFVVDAFRLFQVAIISMAITTSITFQRPRERRSFGLLWEKWYFNTER